MSIRFTKDGYRFIINGAGISIYQRRYWGNYESEMVVTPQMKGRLVRKYSKDIAECLRGYLGSN
jgi:hypothetical protein